MTLVILIETQRKTIFNPWYCIYCRCYLFIVISVQLTYSYIYTHLHTHKMVTLLLYLQGAYLMSYNCRHNYR